MIRRIAAHILTSALPWNFRWFIWPLLFIWIALSAFCNGYFDQLPSLVVFAPTAIYVVGASISLNIIGRASFRFKKIVLTFSALFFTLLSPLAPFLGLIVMAVPYFGAEQMYGEVSNPPYSNCDSLPHKNQLKEALKEGFDVNGKCCFETMIGACLVITPQNRNYPNIDAITSSPLYQDDDVLSYLELKAKPTIGSLISAAGFRSEEIVKKLLVDAYTPEDFAKAYSESVIKNSKVSPIIREYATKRFGNESFRNALLNEVKVRLSEVYKNIGYTDPTSNVRALKMLVKEESFMADEVLIGSLFCSLLDASRNSGNPIRIEETQARYDKAAKELMEQPYDGSFRCYSPGGLSGGVSLLQKAQSKVHGCKDTDCEVYKKILLFFENSGALRF